MDLLKTPLYSLTVDEVLKLASSRSYIPGGGSIAALVGCMGASMAAMVANLTIGKKGYEKVNSICEGHLATLVAGIEDLKERTFADMRSFDRVMAALKLPKGPQKDSELQLALKEAIDVPLLLAQKIVDLMGVNRDLAEIGNSFAVNDCGVAAIMLEAAVRAAVISADVNKGEITDKDYLVWAEVKTKRVLEESKSQMELVVEIVKKRRSY
jgi:formiminotetrahydrofolate cyclodeaminase